MCAGLSIYMVSIRLIATQLKSCHSNLDYQLVISQMYCGLCHQFEVSLLVTGLYISRICLPENRTHQIYGSIHGEGVVKVNRKPSLYTIASKTCIQTPQCYYSIKVHVEYVRFEKNSVQFKHDLLLS